MPSFKWMQRGTQPLVDAVVSFLMLHGAFNLGIRTEVAVTLRFYAVIAGVVLLFVVIGQKLPAPKRSPGDSGVG